MTEEAGPLQSDDARNSFDVVIVGGGVIGSAIAYFLKESSNLSVCVIERDPTYQKASSALSASSIRQQFTTPLNIQMSQFGFAFLSGISEHLGVDGPVDIGLVERGYLVIASRGNGEQLRQNVSVQLEQGAHTELLDIAELGRRFGWLNTDDLDLGAYGARGEGWFDGYAVLQAFRRKARSMGVTYSSGEVVDLCQSQGLVTHAITADGSSFVADRFVNAAGPQADRLCELLDVEVPVSARKRDVFVFDSEQMIDDFPLLFDPSGVWCRPEGNGFICGKAPDAAHDPADVPLEQVDYAAFEETIWPILAHRVPAFEAIRLKSAWAGYYAVNAFDQNAILGPHPDYSNFLLANGFSGHGFQQAPAVGRGLAELIMTGSYQSLDLTPFAFERIAENRPVREATVI